VIKTFKIQIKGRVQGVGFRPFVFKLAKERQVKGTVSNNENGVIIYCTTTKEKAKAFSEAIFLEKPEIAIILSQTIKETQIIKFNDFTIIPSNSTRPINLPLTPDFSVCKSCRVEISNPENRRYNYPFTTCVRCGPRYAITTQFPFERANTSLHDFKMCANCTEEYTNPGDKRFHSQTNSCSICGIQLELVGNSKVIIVEDVISKVSHLLSEGKIIAIKNTNGYLLCSDATNPKAVKELRKRKKRPSKPFAVLYPSIETVKSEFKVSTHEASALQSVFAPIVILQNTKNTNISVRAIAPNLDQTGVLLPSSALLELILKKHNKPIIATSGNMHGSPIISDKTTAESLLKEVADYFVHHNLEIQFPQDDSVVKFADTKQIILRRSRGLAPNYIDAKISTKESTLAMGAELKSTFTFVPNTQTYVSQYFGNLHSFDVLERYKATINQYVDTFKTKPKTIIVDRHSQYQSSVHGSELASEWKANLQEVQHHKAHFASVLGEHDLFNREEKILGVVWDGTGLGEDNEIWGGEFFSYQNKTITRLTHFEYYDWIANDKMAKEPRLALFSLADGDTKNDIKHKFSETEWKIYSKSIEINTLKTSSVGRLFDAISSVLDIVDVNSFEAEAAMRLECCANTYSKNYYIDFLHKENYEIIPTKFIINAIAKSYREGFSKRRLAYSFIYTLAKIIVKMAKKHQFRTVACSGGVFQNALLVSILSKIAKKEDIYLKFNCKLSPNDENVSFGQLMYNQYIKN